MRRPRFEPLAGVLALALIAGMLALWLPNYLRWPLFWDSEHFAQLAREWDAGTALPYRDTFCYNGPGQIYLFWLGGKLFGWGNASAIHAMDVLVLAAFGGCALVWSRRCFQSIVPGSVALVGLLTFYLNCGFQLTGQRTWHAALIASAALMVAQAFPRRLGLAASGVLISLAMLFRPDAAAWGVCIAASLLAGGGVGAARRLAAWVLGVGLGLVLGLLPLVPQGLWRDFLSALRVAAGGAFYDPELMKAQTLDEILKYIPDYECMRPYDLRLLLVGLAGLWGAALWRGDARSRAWLAPWLGAVAAVAAAALVAPYYIGYLVLPVVVATGLSIAPALAALRSELRASPGVGLVATALLGAMLVPGLPTYCVPRIARQTYAAWLTGRPAETTPVFAASTAAEADRALLWRDYRACLTFLRKGLPRGHAVVNGLNPFGEYGGLAIVFPARRHAGASSVSQNALLIPNIASHHIEHAIDAIEASPDTAVVLSSTQLAKYADPAADATAPSKLDRWQSRLVRMVAAHYHPAARFGGLEVWIHNPMQANAKTQSNLNIMKFHDF